MRGWWRAGAVAVAATWVLCYVVQTVAGDPLPPQISVSQYGVGRHGWLFSLWMLAVAAGPVCLYRYRPVRGLGAGWWLLTGAVGCAVMSIVRTDPGGLQESVHAKIHLVGSVLALAGLPIGIMLALLTAAPLWRRSAVALVVVSAVALELLLLSAAGLDTTGAGPATSWAFWQAVALAADLLLPVVQLFGVLTIAPRAGDPEPWWSAYRARTGAARSDRAGARPLGNGPRDLHAAGSAP